MCTSILVDEKLDNKKTAKHDVAEKQEISNQKHS